MNIGNIKRDLEALYEEKDPTKEEIFKILVDNGVLPKDTNDVNFVYQFQEIIRELNLKQYRDGIHHGDKKKDDRIKFYNLIQMPLKIVSEELIETTDPLHKIANWTIRHYSQSNDFYEIKSNLQLALEGKTVISGNTNGEDWTKFGNVGNTFYVLFCQNEPIVEKPFLKTCKYYAEFPLEDIDDLWISNDWISMPPEPGTVYRGNGKAIFNYLTASGGKKRVIGQMLKSNIVGQWRTLEVKIPHSMRVTVWEDNTLA